MMTARSPSSEELARLAACAHVVADKGATSRYVADCAVRAYQGRHLADLCRDLGWTCDADTIVVIASGAGTLTMRWSGNHVDRVPVAAVASSTEIAPEPRFAEPAQREQRLALCHACSDWSNDDCRIAGCRCAGLGRAEYRFSRCPIGRW